MKKSKTESISDQLSDLSKNEKDAVRKIAILTASDLVSSLEYDVGIQDLENAIGNLETAKRIFWSET